MQRFGRTHRPFYRINAIDQQTRRNGRVLENLGHYDPMSKDEDKQIVLKVEEIKAWLAKGAQPSDTVRDMLGKADLLEGDMKAKWLSDRETNMNRGECKKALKEIEGIVASLDKMAEDSEADLTPFANSAKKARNVAKGTLSLAKADVAAKCLADAKDAMSKAEAAKPAPAPEPEPEAEAAEESAE
ncbi:MAG: 30S ribosomal protein S16 [Phycisphaerales bacterium]|nr:30S ribosomal protein S16 [Phycisphaerales bacterium]